MTMQIFQNCLADIKDEKFKFDGIKDDRGSRDNRIAIDSYSNIYVCGGFDSIANYGPFSLNTNGSARNEKWWGDLSKTLGPNGYVVFSIDGDKETNHIY